MSQQAYSFFTGAASAVGTSCVDDPEGFIFSVMSSLSTASLHESYRGLVNAELLGHFKFVCSIESSPDADARTCLTCDPTGFMIG